MANIAIPHRELYLVYKNNNLLPQIQRKQSVLHFLVREYGLTGNDLILQLKSRLETSFFNNLKKRLSVARRKRRGYERFEMSNSSWLQGNFVFSPEKNNPRPVAGRWNFYHLKLPRLFIVLLIFVFLSVWWPFFYLFDCLVVWRARAAHGAVFAVRFFINKKAKKSQILNFCPAKTD